MGPSSPCAFAAAVGLVCAACTADPVTLRWQLAFGEGAPSTRAVLVELRILRGGCDATSEVFRGTIRPRDGMNETRVPRLARGRYGFSARARDPECRWYATGCVDLDLPQDDGAVASVPLDMVAAPENACPGECLDGRCAFEDAGPARLDAAVDGGPDTGPLPDAGPMPDAGPPTCPLPPSWDVGGTYSRELHVSTAGSDSNDGSAGSPLRTIDEAARRATPGTRIRVASGTYGRSSFDDLIGEMDRPIAISGAPGAIIDAAGGNEAFHLADPGFVVIEGFTIRAGTEHGILVTEDLDMDGIDSHHVTIRDVVITGSLGDCIRVNHTSDYFIERGDFTGCRSGLRVNGSQRGRLAASRIHDTEGTTAQGVAVAGGSSDLLVHGNVFAAIPGRAIYAGGYTDYADFHPADAMFEAARIRVVANVFDDVGTSVEGAAMAFAGCVDCVFAHNTVVMAQPYVIRILQEHTDPGRLLPARNGVVANNIVVFDSTLVRRVVNVDSDVTSVEDETFTFRDNLYFAVDDPMFDGPNFEGMIPPETGRIVNQDPRFVSSSTGDFHLQPMSPARASGNPVPETALGDADNACYGTPPTRGALTR